MESLDGKPGSVTVLSFCATITINILHVCGKLPCRRRKAVRELGRLSSGVVCISLGMNMVGES